MAAAGNGLKVAKKRMRLQLKEALKAMSTDQKKDESLILSQKVFVVASLVSFTNSLPV